MGADPDQTRSRPGYPPPTLPPKPRPTLRFRSLVGPVGIVALAAFAYIVWLGAHWLPLPYSSAEIPVYVSRLWDFERELGRSGHVPWWTSVFMNGSSEALPYAGDFPLVPWALFASVLDPLVAGKLVALVSIGASGVTMCLLAFRLLRRETAAAVAGLAYMLHPLLLTRAGAAEHISVVVFLAMLPVAWFFFVGVLEEGRFADVVACAVTLALMVWTQNKHTAIQVPFFAAFAVRSLVREPARRREILRTMGMLAVLALALAAFVVVPSLSELKLLKLFEGDPFDGWQRMYSVHGLGALVDRSAGQGNYLGIALLAVVCGAVIFGRGQNRHDPGLFWLLVAFVVVAIALGHGPALPGFGLIERLPLYRDIRAPEVFFQTPGPFFASLLAGFFVTDVVARTRLARHELAIVAALGVAFFVDAWPFESPIFESNVASSTIAHARALYARLGEEAKSDPESANGKVYVVTSRCFHALGPSWGGPSFVTESALEYMAPRGSGRLAVAAAESFLLRRAYLDLVGVRWVVYDKSDPYLRSSGMATALDAYRKLYPLDFEDEDFAVFRVPSPHPYVSGYTREALAYGDPQRLPELAIALANEGYLLVHAGEAERIEGATTEDVARYAAIYVPYFPTIPLAAGVLAKTLVLREAQPPLPPHQPRDEAIANVTVTRTSAEEIRARFDATAPCMAVIDESDYPYWHATLDGEPVPIVRVAYGLMGVRVSQGAHAMVLRYEAPPSYRWSAIVSLATLVCAVLAANARRLRTALLPT